jgi:hypothetical protein
MTLLVEEVERLGRVPLVWTHPGADSARVHFGYLLSPLMVALLAGLPVTCVPARSARPRLAGAGDFGRLLAGGAVSVWGTGCAALAGPNAMPAAELDLCATRGPISWALLGGAASRRAGAYGDPLWLLPWFYQPRLDKRWDLGVIQEAAVAIPAEFAASVHHIDPRAAPTVAALKARLDDILACRRIVCGDVYGLIVAESFGIPCLYLAPTGAAAGLARRSTDADGGLPLEIADLYAGLRVAALPLYVPECRRPIDWAALLAAIDAAWCPAWLREDDLVERFPLPLRPLAIPPGGDPFAQPLLQDLQLCPSDETEEVPVVAERRRRSDGPAAALQEWVDEHQTVPLSWAATSPVSPAPNLGDALSAVLVGAIAGLKVTRRNFDDTGERLVSVGTIGHAQRHGTVHLWGTALDPKRNAFDAALGRFAVPPDTRFVVHAVRGRYTAAYLREQGIAVPEAYGDPVWFLPRLVATPEVEKRWDLGVIVHITELEAPLPDAAVIAAYRRYRIAPSLADSVRIINTYTGPGLADLMAKVDEIRACRRIASTSFHGLVIPEAFGIPCVWFSMHAGESLIADIDDEEVAMDHRVRDWYSGTSKRRLPIFCTERHKPTRWDRLMRWIDATWEPLATDAAGLLAAFPLRRVVAFEDAAWQLDPALFEGMTF